MAVSATLEIWFHVTKVNETNDDSSDRMGKSNHMHSMGDIYNYQVGIFIDSNQLLNFKYQQFLPG